MANKIKLTDALVRKFGHPTKPRTTRYIESRILIVCEGEKTEPNYFMAFDRSDNGVFVVDLSFGGGGVNTVQVVDEAIRLKTKAEQKRQPYDVVWAVFDRDSFKAVKFNSAISKAEAHGVSCAWSNEAFELWYLLHFEFRNTGMSRQEYCGCIERHINDSPLYKKKKPYKYKKNHEAHYEEMTTYGSLDIAIANAERLDGLYDDQAFANHNPRTLVYKLVRQLLGRDETFNTAMQTRLENP